MAKFSNFLLRFDGETAISLAKLIRIIIKMSISIGMSWLLTQELFAAYWSSQQIGEMLYLYLVSSAIECSSITLILRLELLLEHGVLATHIKGILWVTSALLYLDLRFCLARGLLSLERTAESFFLDLWLDEGKSTMRLRRGGNHEIIQFLSSAAWAACRRSAESSPSYFQVLGVIQSLRQCLRQFHAFVHAGM